MSKYKNKKITHNGITFDSKKEFERYKVLSIWQKMGVISELTTQKTFILAPSVKLRGEKRAKRAIEYRADFVYVINKTGEQVVEDVKSKATAKNPVYRIKKHLMKAVHGIDVVEVWQRITTPPPTKPPK